MDGGRRRPHAYFAIFCFHQKKDGIMNRRSFALAFLIAGLAATPLATLAQGWHPVDRMAVIASVQGSSLTLDNGATVFLRNGTVILPTGWRLHAGQRIHLIGQGNGHHRINADRIVIMRRHAM
jgi:hypothetical protein